jgi:hypothetical protein
VKSEARGDAGWAGLTYLRWRVHMLLKEVLRTRKVLAFSEKALFLWSLSCILCAHILIPTPLDICSPPPRECEYTLLWKLFADEKSARLYCLVKKALSFSRSSRLLCARIPVFIRPNAQPRHRDATNRLSWSLCSCHHCLLAHLPILATEKPQTGSPSPRAHATLAFSHFSPPRHRELSGGRLPSRRIHDPCRTTIDRLESCTGSPETLGGPSERLTPRASTAVVPESRCLLGSHSSQARIPGAACCASGGSLRGRGRGVW